MRQKQQAARTNTIPSAHAYEEAVEPAFRDLFNKWAGARETITEDDLERFNARVRTAVLPPTNLLDEQVGPFYDTSGVRSWAGVSRQAVSGKVQRNRLIACQLEDGTWVYPTWQFEDDGTTNADLITVWRTLRGPADQPHADPWSCALWMRAPHPSLDGLTPVDWINRGNEVEAVETLARQIAARWAQ